MDHAEALTTEPDRRERIMSAAFALFVERGFAGTSTLQIATRARVSKRDVYALFADKTAILTACIAGRVERMREPLRLPPPQSRAALAATLAAFGTTTLRELIQPTTVATFRLAIAEAERAPDVARALHEAGQVSVRQGVVDLLAASIAAGLLAGDAEALADAFFGTLQTNRLLLRLLLRLADPPDEPAIEALAQAAAQAVLAGGATL
jgi:AcrR family transcriptional regulator